MSETTLPQLVLEVAGQVVSTNLDAFKASARDFIDDINTDLRTDEDFIEAESAVKVCKETEDRIDEAKAAAISRMATVDELFKVVDEIREEIRAKRLVLERTVRSRKEMVRTEIVEEAYKGLLDHCERTFCNWTQDDDGFYETACGNTFFSIDGSPAENKFIFCPYCGKTLIDHPKEPTP